jgi:hypothetical protein
VDVVASWTGSRADALRQALRMSNEAFAGHLGVAVRTVAYWRVRPEVVPRPVMQEILDTALMRASAEAREVFHAIVAGERAAPRIAQGGVVRLDDVESFTAWLSSTSASDLAIEQADQAAATLAGLHTRLPARKLLADVLRVHSSTHAMLRSGRQHMRQARDLLRIDGLTLAHASVLLGDLGQDQDANKYGRAALLCLQEADASQAPAWYALAKTARWQRDYASAADLASRGFETGPITPMSVQLASYEANSAALMGDTQRARDALNRSELIAGALTADDLGGSPWDFPPQRRAVFRLSVLLRTADPEGALQAAADADQTWAAGEPQIAGTWAQVRIGAAIAHLEQGQVDGTAEDIKPVLAMPPDMRIATVTGWLHDLDTELRTGRHASSPLATSLRHQIRDFTAAALPSHTKEAG